MIFSCQNIIKGTGCFLLMNSGSQPLINKNSGLLSTVLFQLGPQEKPIYALEGSIEVGGSTLNWMKDNMEFYDDFDEMMQLVKSVPDNGNVMFCPSTGGLFCPYWVNTNNGTFQGISQQTRKAHLVRAGLECIAFRNRDVVQAIQTDYDVQVNLLRVDGGLSVNDYLMQFQADLIQKDVVCSKTKDATSLGAALAAGLFKGIFNDVEHLKSLIESERVYTHNISTKDQNEDLYQKWETMIKKTYL